VSTEGTKIEAPQAQREWVREGVSPSSWGRGLGRGYAPPQKIFEFLSASLYFSKRGAY